MNRIEASTQTENICLSKFRWDASSRGRATLLSSIDCDRLISELWDESFSHFRQRIEDLPDERAMGPSFDSSSPTDSSSSREATIDYSKGVIKLGDTPVFWLNKKEVSSFQKDDRLFRADYRLIFQGGKLLVTRLPLPKEIPLSSVKKAVNGMCERESVVSDVGGVVSNASAILSTISRVGTVLGPVCTTLGVLRPILWVSTSLNSVHTAFSECEASAKVEDTEGLVYHTVDMAGNAYSSIAGLGYLLAGGADFLNKIGGVAHCATVAESAFLGAFSTTIGLGSYIALSITSAWRIHRAKALSDRLNQLLSLEGQNQGKLLEALYHLRHLVALHPDEILGQSKEQIERLETKKMRQAERALGKAGVERLLERDLGTRTAKIDRLIETLKEERCAPFAIEEAKELIQECYRENHAQKVLYGIMASIAIIGIAVSIVALTTTGTLPAALLLSSGLFVATSGLWLAVDSEEVGTFVKDIIWKYTKNEVLPDVLKDNSIAEQQTWSKRVQAATVIALLGSTLWLIAPLLVLGKQAQKIGEVVKPLIGRSHPRGDDVLPRVVEETREKTFVTEFHHESEDQSFDGRAGHRDSVLIQSDEEDENEWFWLGDAPPLFSAETES